MEQLEMPQIDIGEEIMTAIHYINSSNGASLSDIEQYLSQSLEKVPDLEIIQSKLNDAIDKGLITKLSNGNFKINGNIKRKDPVNEDENNISEFITKITGIKQRMEATVSDREENGENGLSIACEKLPLNKLDTTEKILEYETEDKPDPLLQNVDKLSVIEAKIGIKKRMEATLSNPEKIYEENACKGFRSDKLDSIKQRLESEANEEDESDPLLQSVAETNATEANLSKRADLQSDSDEKAA